MALTKEITEDKIEVVGEWKYVQVRTATILKEDGVEINRSFHRHTLKCTDDISGQSTEVQAICNAVWTDELKATFQELQDNSVSMADQHSP